MRQFFDFVDAWERDVALELLRKRGITAGGGLGSLSPPTVYAVLSTAAHECATDLRDTLKAAMTPHKLHTLTEVPPGLLLFAVDSDSKPRQWAAVQLPGLKGKEDKSNALLKSAIADIARKLATQQQSPDRTTALWEGLPIVLQLAPSSAASFSPHILGHLHDRGDHFASVLHAFDLVLASRGSDLWKSLNEDNEFPLLILDSILDNSAYARTLMRPEMVGNLEKREQFLSWISLYCDTLNGAMFGEALARLANFLCEKLQHAQYASTCCAMALEGGVKLVQRYFVTSPGDASEGPEAEERTKAINKVVNLYASNFAAVALGSATVRSCRLRSLLQSPS